MREAEAMLGRQRGVFTSLVKARRIYRAFFLESQMRAIVRRIDA
jgi:hypothetical protein